jgi:Mrp family chromosome partitioning ATPase
LLGLLVALLLERLQPALPAAPVQTVRTQLPVVPPAPAAAPRPPQRPRLAAERNGVPVLAEFPDLAKLSAADVSAADYVIDRPNSGFARAIAALDRHIATTGWKAPKVLAVASAEPGNAKTNIALALARAAAKRGQRVMLIDGDAHWPAAAPMMKVKRPDGGIAEVVMGRARLAHSVTQDSRSSVMLLSWARRPARIRQLLASRRMHELMGFLRSSCDLIVIDTPPVLASGGVDYTPFSDAVLFVADARAQAATVRALGMLESMRAPTVGIALTG